MNYKLDDSFNIHSEYSLNIFIIYRVSLHTYFTLNVIRISFEHTYKKNKYKDFFFHNNWNGLDGLQSYFFY